MANGEQVPFIFRGEVTLLFGLVDQIQRRPVIASVTAFLDVVNWPFHIPALSPSWAWTAAVRNDGEEAARRPVNSSLEFRAYCRVLFYYLFVSWATVLRVKAHFGKSYSCTEARSTGLLSLLFEHKSSLVNFASVWKSFIIDHSWTLLLTEFTDSSHWREVLENELLSYLWYW